MQTVLLEVDAVTCFQDLSNRTGMSVFIMFFSVGMSVVITYVLQCLFSVVITYVLRCWYVCGHYLCSSVLVFLWSLLMLFSVGISVVITYVLQCWYVCGHYLFSSVLIDLKNNWHKPRLSFHGNSY